MAIAVNDVVDRLHGRLAERRDEPAFASARYTAEVDEMYGGGGVVVEPAGERAAAT